VTTAGVLCIVQTLSEGKGNEGAIGLFLVAFILITMGIVYVQVKPQLVQNMDNMQNKIK
jgi:amino acid permease